MRWRPRCFIDTVRNKSPLRRRKSNIFGRGYIRARIEITKTRAQMFIPPFALLPLEFVLLPAGLVGCSEFVILPAEFVGRSEFVPLPVGFVPLSVGFVPLPVGFVPLPVGIVPLPGRFVLLPGGSVLLPVGFVGRGGFVLSPVDSIVGPDGSVLLVGVPGPGESLVEGEVVGSGGFVLVVGPWGPEGTLMLVVFP